jgi:GT2 family glycosyltransferase
MITIVIPCFHSEKIIEDRIFEIGEKFKILIIENSRNFNLKTKLENIYKNVQVILPNENLGWGRAANLGIISSKTDFVFLTQPDVKIIDNCIEKLNELINHFKDFTVITPHDVGNSNFINYEVYSNYPKENFVKNFLLEQVDYVDLTWLINKSNFENRDLWDENIFLYFEAMDFAKRLVKNQKKIFVVKNIKTFHIGSSSHDKSLSHYALLTRAWHYNWSKFYFLKKHFGYFYALRKSLSLFLKLNKKIIISIFLFKKKDFFYALAEIRGLVNSIFFRPSSYRPYKN